MTDSTPRQWHLLYTKEPNTIKVHYTNNVYMGDIICKEDGFYDWYPALNRGGYIPSWVLRELADYVDELNEPWQKQIDNDPILNGEQENASTN